MSIFSPSSVRTSFLNKLDTSKACEKLLVFSPKSTRRSFFSKFDSSRVSEQLKLAKLNISSNQVDQILEFAKELSASKENFRNVRKSEFKELANFKIQIFKNGDDKSLNLKNIKIYINPRYKNNQSSDLVSGAFKVFNPCHVLKLDPSGTAEIKLSARLRLDYESTTFNENKEAIRSIYEREIEVLKQFRKTPHICQLKNYTIYMGMHKKLQMEKMVMYQKLYEQDLFSYAVKLSEGEIEKSNKSLKKIFRGCLKGLKTIHEKKLIHADIKMENIFLDWKGRPYIGDLGAVTEITKAQEAIFQGTLGNFAPETIKHYLTQKNLPNIGTAIDIWALGCSLLSLYAKAPPLWSEFIENLFQLTDLQNSLTIRLNTLPKLEVSNDSEIKKNKKHQEEKYRDLSKSAPILMKQYLGIIDTISRYTESLQKLQNKPEVFKDYFTDHSQELSKLSTIISSVDITLKSTVENFFDCYDFCDVANEFTRSEKKFISFKKKDPSFEVLLLEFLLSVVNDALEKQRTILLDTWKLLEEKSSESKGVSDRLKRVLGEMLKVNPDKRITAKEALTLLT